MSVEVSSLIAAGSVTVTFTWIVTADLHTEAWAAMGQHFNGVATAVVHRDVMRDTC